MKGRHFILSKDAFNDPGIAYTDAHFLYGIMLYPEDEKKIREWHKTLDAFCAEKLHYHGWLGLSPEESKLALIEHHEEALNLLYNMDHYRKVAAQAVHSREKGMKAAPARMGSLAGEILCKALKPSCGSINKACEEIILKGKQQHLEDGTRLDVPGMSTLKKIWAEYRLISPFWAALHATGERYRSLLKNGPLISLPVLPDAHVIFREFVGIAEFFRSSLLEFIDPSRHLPVIPKVLHPLVWQVLDEDKNAIPPIKISVH